MISFINERKRERENEREVQWTILHFIDVVNGVLHMFNEKWEINKNAKSACCLVPTCNRNDMFSIDGLLFLLEGKTLINSQYKDLYSKFIYLFSLFFFLFGKIV